MPRPSSIDQLPPEIREEIGRLRDGGATIDQIVAHLRGLAAVVSRSALGRHIKGMDAVGEKLRRSRSVAEVLVRQLGDAPASRTMQLNLELMHTVILDLFMASREGDGAVDGDGLAALAGNPEGVMMLAKALDHLGRASKSDVDYAERIGRIAAERATKDAASAAAVVARERGISADTDRGDQGGDLRGARAVRDAWCAGQRVQVSGREAPPDHRQVACRTCGAKRGLDCRVVGGRSGELLYAGH